jgi:TetR/AcrR family transcriptional regulator, mexJK operon transcriptional repressor
MEPNTVKNPRHRPVDQAKRTAILDAAREEFFAFGFAAASIESIAQASKTSKVTVYNRFGTKEALFAAVVERECFMMNAGLDRWALHHNDLRNTLIDFGEKALGFLMQPHVMRFERRIAAESEHMPHVGELFLNAGPRRMQETLIAMIDQAVDSGAMSQCDSRLAAGHLYGMIIGFDIFMSRFTNAPIDKNGLRANVTATVDRFLAAYSVS